MSTVDFPGTFAIIRRDSRDFNACSVSLLRAYIGCTALPSPTRPQLRSVGRSLDKPYNVDFVLVSRAAISNGLQIYIKMLIMIIIYVIVHVIYRWKLNSNLVLRICVSIYSLTNFQPVGNRHRCLGFPLCFHISQRIFRDTNKNTR